MKLDTRALMSIALLLGCAAGERLDTPRPTVVRTPRDAYVAAARIEPDVLRAWEDASRRALRSGLRIAPSFRERIAFPATDPHAVAYHFTLVRGQSLHVIVAPAAGAANPFVDMFHSVGSDLFRPVHWAEESPARRTFVARSSGDYVLRIQPRAGAGGIHDVAVLGNVSLQFPVPGADVSSIGGVFGDTRDEGVRTHEGVDIMAPRGTPVLAVADGYIEQARNTPTGGLVIWQADAAGELTYYYAHLDELLVQAGTYVKAGAVIGAVGNTGNARGATPHLHFGAYLAGKVPVDPAPLLTATVAVDDVMIQGYSPGTVTRASRDRVRLRRSPSLAGPVITELSPETPLLVLGDVGDWQRVVLPDGTTGFVAARLTEPVYAGSRPD